MRTLPKYFTFALIVASVMPAYAGDTLPTGEQVMDHYLKSIGGKRALKRIKNRVIKGTIAISAGGQERNMKFTKFATAPNKTLMRLEIETMGTMEQGTDGNLVWATSPMGAQLLSGPIEKSMKQDAVFNPELRWRDLYKEVKCVDRVDFDGMPCYKVTQTTKDDDHITAYFEEGTWLQRGMEKDTDAGRGQKAHEVQVLKGYKEVDGILYPHTITQTMSMGAMTQKMTITRESVEQNIDIPADTFSPPAAILEQAKTAAEGNSNNKGKIKIKDQSKNKSKSKDESKNKNKDENKSTSKSKDENHSK